MVPARGARLPHALRRGVVDGDPLGRLLPRRSPETPRTDFACEVRGLHDAPGPRTVAGAARAPPRLALRRGAAPRRGDASPRDPRSRPLRQSAPEPERRATSPRRSLEVRL